jgi:hypothetical protein
MTDNTYNGWTNYATWRVNLEVFDGMDIHDMGWNRLDVYDLAMTIKEYAEEIVCPFKKGENTLAESYALAFLSEVNWHEIAKHMIEEYAEEEAA